jgi:8-oxo-dGTP diphosphatase
MRVLDGGFQPNDEVDELRWVPVERAAELLDYEQDRELVAAAASVP